MTGSVIVVGAGPTGLAVAAELALAGTTVTVVERRAERPLGSKATAMQARVLELLDMRGVVDTFLAAGMPWGKGHFGGLPLPLDQLPSRYNHLLVIPQHRTELLLEQRATALGVTVLRGHRVTGLDQDDHAVTVIADHDGGQLRLSADYLVAADGSRSTVRELLGVAFPGQDDQWTSIAAEVRLTDPPAGVSLASGPLGKVNTAPLGDGYYKVICTDSRRNRIPVDEPATLDELRSSMRDIAGTDHGITDPLLLARFGDASRQIEQYRHKRVLFAGDAAHMHYPAGGQGMNTGIQDAFNLGWKLAAVADGRAHPALLDTYHAERHPVGQQLLANTRAQVPLIMAFGDDPLTATKQYLATEILPIPGVAAHIAGTESGIGIRYPAEEDAHPRVGHRLPDLHLPALRENGTPLDEHRAFPLLRDGNFLLLTTADSPMADTPAGRHLRVVTLPADDGETLLGAPSVLVRPDGHIAWAGGDGTDDRAALHAALPHGGATGRPVAA
ncbi:FAD-dependent oxidoreductase [Kitasatospora sp. NPDC001539]|uniref:FAD-dependent oxidoreductase n=1 Tax=Kitasatospora sp. NPDC001539 TaxID=3154384 RepID=UPI003318CBDF